MADVAVGGPLAVDRLSIGGDWRCLKNGKSVERQRVAEQGENGDEIASEVILETTRISDEYVCVAAAGNLAIPDVGQIKGGFHIDSAKVTCNSQGWPRLVVSAHQHAENTHSVATAVFSASLVIPAGFGVPTVGTLGAAAGKESLDYELKCEHFDDDDGEGGHLAGASYDGHETLTVGFKGVPSEPLAALVAADWDLVPEGDDQGNKQSDKTTYTYEKSVTRNA